MSLSLPSLVYLRSRCLVVAPPPGVKVKGFCWLWQGSTNSDGYGTVSWEQSNGKRKTLSVHRTALELVDRPVPDGLVPDHLCRVRNCFNPAHLEAVTQRVNLLRSPITVASKHLAKTHCKNGHPFNEENTIVRNAERGWRDCRICRTARRDKSLATWRAKRRGK